MGWKVLIETDKVKAAFIESMLRNEGIPFVEKSTNMTPVIFGSGGSVKILVPEDKLEEAKKILEEGIKDD
ncbi:MAG: DUF2007 domain-containing protein [Thermotogae bacterium]|nr:DUF2007 domain-containing protein [Thermotogaceae bacterium]OQX56787.1 MAG: hypothetical protein B5M49_05380 [Thermotoga sp. 4484_232]RKX48272.1 MAG: DUF2007 domain-containing protein [Thermotogota bacterium]RKX52584.1 MAG: DUF2007 domain-containing protein [Thermotoga sp.]RKX56362.1 MAG: DUF2007 domain-containing protein [Thermotoga sp.]